MTVTLYAEFIAKEGSERRVAALVSAFAAEVRGEPGNVSFSPYTKSEARRHYVVVEVYQDDAAFHAHIGADHGTRFNAALADLIEGDGSELTWLDEV